MRKIKKNLSFYRDKVPLHLIFGAYDINSGACGSALNLVNNLNKQNQIEIIGGILELEASSLLKQFFAVKRI